jgi:hypothetical protein
MQNNSKTVTPRKRRLPHVYCTTANHLRLYILTEDHISETTKQTARELIDRLAELTDITRQEFPADVSRGWPEECALKDAARVYHFEMEESDPRRAECARLLDALRDMGNLAVDLWRAQQDVKRAKAAPAERPAALRKSSTDIKDDIWKEFGIPAHSSVAFEQVLDPRPTEFICIEENENKKRMWIGTGIVTETSEQIVTLKESDGEEYEYQRAAYRFYRATEVTTKPQRPAADATYSPDPERAREERLKRLRDRLAKIDADDITDSSARMKLETEIYNLEHPPNLDDWSAWVEN